MNCSLHRTLEHEGRVIGSWAIGTETGFWRAGSMEELDWDWDLLGFG